MTVAKDLLASRTTSAVALLRALDMTIGDSLSWEPESVWLELERNGVDVPESARDRLMAANALRLVPAFYWDAIVFEKTCVAFDGRPAHVDILEEPSPSAMAWGVIESAWIRERHGDQSLRPEHEPIAYVAVVLERAGLVVAPEQLAFAQETLDSRLPASSLATDVRDRWKTVDKAKLEDLHLEETRVDIQIARLAAVELHVRARRTQAEADLARLK